MAHSIPGSASMRWIGLRTGSLVHVVSALVWAALAASTVYWSLKLFSGSRPLPSNVVSVGQSAVSRGDPQRLFSSARPAAVPGVAPPAASSRFKLAGVVASAGGHGVATLSVDGGPFRAYREGAAVADGWVLQSVTQQGVHVGPAGGAAAAVLQLPALPPASRGTPSPSAPDPASGGAVPQMSLSGPPAGGFAGAGMPHGAEAPPLMIEPPSAGPGARPRARATVPSPVAAAASSP